MTTLYRYRRTDIGLAECLAESFPGRILAGFTQSPCRLTFMDWDGRQASAPDVSQVYEARLFCEPGELRWLRDPESAGKGRAAWISEMDQAPCGFEAAGPLEGLEAVRAMILSYGKDFPGAAVPHRIGDYELREYVGRAPSPAGDDGNMIVLEQRIVRIVPRTETGGMQ